VGWLGRLMLGDLERGTVQNMMLVAYIINTETKDTIGCHGLYWLFLGLFGVIHINFRGNEMGTCHAKFTQDQISIRSAIVSWPRPL
jgi:hypothetical protein